MKANTALAGAAFLALFAIGTNVSAQTPAPSAVAGTYRLVTVADKALPVIVEDGEKCRDELVAATLTLKPDGTWTLVHTERDVCGEKVETEEEDQDGKYTLQGETIAFTGGGEEEPDDDGDIDIDKLRTGTLGENAISILLNDNTVAVFRR